MGKPRFSVVAAGCALFLAAFEFFLPLPAQIREAPLTIDEYQGLLGTDSTGRRNLCDHLRKLLPAASSPIEPGLLDKKTPERMALSCEGYHSKIIVLAVTNWSSDFRALRSEALLKEILDNPYRVVTDSMDGLVPQVGAEEPMHRDQIRAKLQEIGAKTVSDLLFACGFEKLVVRDAATQAEYLKQPLSGSGIPRP